VQKTAVKQEANYSGNKVVLYTPQQTNKKYSMHPDLQPVSTNSESQSF
jgi:hypothetical protein